MQEACEPADGEKLRMFVLDVLTQTEFSEGLADMIDASDMGLTKLSPLLNEARSPRTAGQLRGQVARFLESYPDHPSLLLLRALAEVRADDSDETVVHIDLVGFLSSVGEKYAAKPEDVASSLATAMDVLDEAGSPDADWLEAESLTVAGYEEGLVARELVRELGMDRGEALAWNVLVKIADAALAVV
jgi:hypothetical protein